MGNPDLSRTCPRVVFPCERDGPRLKKRTPPTSQPRLFESGVAFLPTPAPSESSQPNKTSARLQPLEHEVIGTET